MSKHEAFTKNMLINMILHDKHRSLICNAGGTFLKGSGLMIQVDAIPAAFFKR